MGRKKKKARRGGSLSLVQIQKLLQAKEQEVADLTDRREALLAELQEVEKALAANLGAGATGRRRKKKKVVRKKKAGRKKKVGRKKTGRKKKATARKKGGRKKKTTRKKKVARKKTGRRKKAAAGQRGPRGAGSLHQYIRRVLGKAGDAMKLADLAAAIKKSGYKTTSSRFGVIVNQRLAEMNDVVRVGRGMYKLKK